MTLSIDTKLTDSIWQRGMIYPGGYSYHAKVYELPSQFGINGGRVSKLTVCDRKDREIINYQRGWVVLPIFKWEFEVKPRFWQWKRRAVLKVILAHYDGLEFARIVEAERAEAEAAD